MKKILSLVLVLVLVGLASASADSLTNTESVGTFKIDQTTTNANHVAAQEYPLQTIGASTTVASTTAVTITATTGRTFIEISAGDDATMTNQIWVGVGTATVAVGTGRLVTQDNPLRLPADDGVVFSTIASEAVPMCIIQGTY